MFKIIAGLGNPGAQYGNTRHNAGALLADELRLMFAGGGNWKNWKNAVEFAKTDMNGADIFIVRPVSYMNNSGKALRQFCDFYKITAEEILVCYDDFSLNTGAVRIRKSGSGGGHNGMGDIINSFSTQDIARLRIGIGPLPGGTDPKNYVLEPMSAGQKKQLLSSVKQSADAVVSIIKDGIDAAMNKYNKAVE